MTCLGLPAILMQRLKEKVAVVTGASSGIGSAIAKAFASEGARVVVNYKQSKESALSIVRHIEQMQGCAVAIKADMACTAEIVELIKTASALFGRIDIWVNNAGADILTGHHATASVDEKLQQLIDVDMKGTINACWSIVPIMQAQGRGVIVNMGWDLSIHGFKGQNPQIFACTKAGVLGFTRALAKSVGPDIRVNMLSPGWIATSFANEYMDEDYYKDRIKDIPLSRFGQVEDVAAAAVFLACDDASYITGEAIKINGGLI